MKIIYSRDFVKEFKLLPVEIQKLFKKQESLFRKNWKDSRLNIKKLVDHNFTFSFRVTRNYRVLFIFVEVDTIIFGKIAHRKDVYE